MHAKPPDGYPIGMSDLTSTTAARILDLGLPPPSRPRSGVAPRIALALVAISTLAAHGGAPRGFPRTALVADESPARAIGHIRTTDPMTMPRSTTLAATLGLFATTTSTLAQDAVQWRVEDGGNGHWYATTMDAETGDSAQLLAVAMGGHLVCINSQEENEFVEAIFLATKQTWAWIGLRQQSGQNSPDAGWYWVSGEPLGYSNWTDHNGGFPTGAPDDTPCALPPWGV